jgi:hypothetical protein
MNGLFVPSLLAHLSPHFHRGKPNEIPIADIHCMSFHLRCPFAQTPDKYKPADYQQFKNLSAKK